jgi:phosphate:Na+ symporter
LLVVPFLKQLVNFLETLFRDEEKARGRARYLTPEVMEIPAAALAALRKETIHLYDRSLEAIVHAMNLHRTAIFSDAEIDEVIERSTSPIKINVDQVYQSEIKSLYGEILEYASMSQTYMDQQGNNEIFELKQAARKIIEMVKDVRELQKNLNFYSKSHNAVIIQQYNQLRAELVRVLRMVQEFREIELDEAEILTRIEVEKANAKDREIKQNQEVDALIRAHKIDSHSASSLINDISFAQSISKKLLTCAETLWVRDEEIKYLGDEYGYE